MTAAKVIADSISPDGHRLTTLEVRLHRFVLAEVNTHRTFSRGSASSRAIPIAKQVMRVLSDPALPVEWGRNQAGMQAGEPLGDCESAAAEAVWLEARDAAVAAVDKLVGLGVHKQVANRLLEPFMWTTVIISATDWTGFWEQRCSPLAQPEIRVAAEAIKAAYDASMPTKRNFHDQASETCWHLPYVTAAERHELGLADLLKLSAARCARVSYLNHDGVRDLAADYALYDRLVSSRPGHWSPLEHVAHPDIGRLPGNFTGWRQLRHMVEDAA